MQYNLRRIVTAFFFVVAAFSVCGRAQAENLFQESAFNSYVADKRARQVGDVVTLLIVESASAESSQDMAKDKNVDVSTGFTKALSSNGAAATGGRSERVSADFAYSSDNAMATARAGRFRGQITAEVKEVDAAGKMFIAGRQKITINGEEQLIRVSGWLRGKDIDENNTALSLRLSDATIEYIGAKDDDEKGLLRKTWGLVRKIW